MTVMIILGGVAAFYFAVLLHRLTIWAAPIGAGLMLASLLGADGWRWSDAGAMGAGAGLSVYIAGGMLVSGAFPALIRLPVLILFAGAAACAGFQGGWALAGLGGLETGLQRGPALGAALFTAAACWRGMTRGTVYGNAHDVERHGVDQAHQAPS